MRGIRVLGCCVVGILATLIAVNSQQPPPAPPFINPCDAQSLEDIIDPCMPCSAKDKWHYMVAPLPVEDNPSQPPPPNPDDICSERKFFSQGEKCAGVEITQGNLRGCFNDDPSETVVLRDPARPPGEFKSVLVARGEPLLDPFRSAIGFTIPEVPFYRYFLPHNRKHGAPGANPPIAKDYNYLDIGGVGKYFIEYDKNVPPGPPAGDPKYDTDFELFEWPGRDSKDQKAFLETVTSTVYGCIDDKQTFDPHTNRFLCDIPHMFITLAFNRATSKFLNYPCNAKLGTHVMAFAQALPIIEAEERGRLKEHDGIPTQRVHLSHGMNSMHKSYIHPLDIRNVTLMEMVNTDDCQWCVNAPLTQCSQDRKDACLEIPNWDKCRWDPADNDYTDLRTVRDFAFTTERLILGMQCGILVVTQIMAMSFLVYTAKLQTTSTLTTHFPEPMNKLAGSVCCQHGDGCSREATIIAAYSYDHLKSSSSSSSGTDYKKYIYISFDLGDTFERKTIGREASLINLIQNMYRIYDRWDLYYKMLETENSTNYLVLRESEFSQSKPLQNYRAKLFSQFDGFDDWFTLSPEEKELFATRFAIGSGQSGRAETGRLLLKQAFCNFTLAATEGDNTMPRLVANNSGRLVSPTFVNNTDIKRYYPDTDYTPKWVKDSIALRYKDLIGGNDTDKWTWAECSQIPSCREQFEEDTIVDDILKEYTGTPEPRESAEVLCPVYLSADKRSVGENKDTYFNETETFKWKARTFLQVPKHKPNEAYCLEVVSLLVLQEEENLLLLCKVGYCKATPGSTAGDCNSPPDDPKDSESSGHRYAIFEAAVRPKVPIIHAKRRSKRIFQCPLVTKRMDGHDPNIPIEPVLVKVPMSSGVMILNCRNVVFFSINGGRTLFNAVFYFETEDPNNSTAPTEYRRSSQLAELDVPPQIALDTHGHVCLITFKHYYLYGIISYNRDFRLVRGKIYKSSAEVPAMNNISDTVSVAQPWFSNAGEPLISIVLITVLKQSDYQDFYTDRTAIRFVSVPISFYRELRPFYSENLKIEEEGKANNWDFSDCNTYSFEYKPTEVHLDIGDSAVVRVQVIDADPLLPLGIYANMDQGLTIKATRTNRSVGTPQEIIAHDWDVEITAIANLRSKEEAQVDAWFGSDYTNLMEYSTYTVLVNFPTMRCHVQPSGSVTTEIGCLGKIMVAHEDEYRPQCRSKFVNNFNYTLERGFYDPELARYWLENNPEFVERQSNGDLLITYDYTRFGCPLEPYLEDDFAPDLRILTEDIRRNSSLGEKFNGSYVILEIFGASGYNFTWNVGMSGCKRPPQKRRQMIRDWVIRRRIFNITSGRMARMFPNRAGAPAAGSLLFNGKDVDEHLNIWNRVNYQSCYIEENDINGKLPDYTITETDKEWDYEVMNNNLSYCEKPPCSKEDEGTIGGLWANINRLKWSPKNRPRVFIFLVVAVDSDGTLCNYFTWFGVSLPKARDMDTLTSILCFLLFTLFWICLVVAGYHIRKYYIRKQYIDEARSERLKQAAWTVIYRYEKLLHESENKQLENEITDYQQQINKQAREKAFARLHKDKDDKKSKDHKDHKDDDKKHHDKDKSHK